MGIQEMDYDTITNACLAMLARPKLTALIVLDELMGAAGVPMHDPVHHYIMAATLLTLAAHKSGMAREELAGCLSTAEDRARKVLPGFCGWWGCCGAGVGCGIFACVWLHNNPKREQGWDTANALTARCLAKISSVGGPRCCKRTSYLALMAALDALPELLGLDLGPVPDIQCSWYNFNSECRRERCPFYAGPMPANAVP